MKVRGFAVMERRGSLVPFEYQPEPLGPHDVEIRVTHCGICYSDVHMIDDDFGRTAYPLVPGHEVVGLVADAGSSVTDLKAGQRVGLGWQRGACLACVCCRSGHEQYCREQVNTITGHHGGFAESVRADSRFVFPIPDALSSEGAAPLLCAGATVYSPLAELKVGPGQRVGVIGIGGLGHLAVQFANAMGAEVTAFSTSPSKEAAARRFGARHFEASHDAKRLGELAGTLDLVLSTVHADLNWNAYINMLKPRGTFCIVGVAPKGFEIVPRALVGTGRRVMGSKFSGRRMMSDMLEFAGRRGIQAQVEVCTMLEANAAIEALRKSQGPYRTVLVRP